MDPKLYKIAKNGSRNFSNNLDAVDSEHRVTSEKNNILHIAAKSGNEQSTDQILQSYPHLVHEINTKGETPLHIAARLGHFDVARLLITCAKQQRVDESGNNHPLRIFSKKKLTVMHEAVKNDKLNVVDLLIEEDPGLASTTDDTVESPLFMAVERRFYQVALRILETFPNCSCSGRNGMTIIGLPRGYQLLRSSSVRLQGLMMLLFSFRNCCNRGISGADFVDKVLKKTGPGILEEKDSFGWTPLHYAAYIGNRDVVKLFLETNSSLAYTKNKEGMSALHIAAQRGCIRVIETLTQKYPDISELLDDKDQTALHVAVANGNRHVVRIFLHMTPFNDLLNEPTRDGNTCLHVAALQGHDEIVMMLVNDRRVDQAAINNLGMTAADIVFSRKNLHTYKKFLFSSRIEIKGVHQTSSERRVIQESRMGQLDGEKLLKTTQKTGLQVPSQDDKPAGPTAQENEKSLLAFTDPKIDSHGGRKYEAEDVQNLSTINLLVATIIAGITFSSFIQMPGGYNNEGMPILRNFKTFKRFLLFDSLAFGLSAASICLHFASPFIAMISGMRYIYSSRFSTLLTCLSLCFTLVAFVSARSAVLNEKGKFNFDDLVPFIYSFVFPLVVSLYFYLVNRVCEFYALPYWLPSV